MADKVLENADPEWVKEIIYEAKELYPMLSQENLITPICKEFL